MPVKFTDEMRERINNASAEGNPILVATASAAGVPDIVFKGSTMVFDDDHLAYWERALATTFGNVQENGNVCFFYRNPQARLLWKIFGVAEVHKAGATRDEVMGRTIQAELDRDPERKGAAVVVRIDRVLEMGKETMRRD